MSTAPKTPLMTIDRDRNPTERWIGGTHASWRRWEADDGKAKPCTGCGATITRGWVAAHAGDTAHLCAGCWALGCRLELSR